MELENIRLATEQEKKTEGLRKEAFNALREAEEKMYAFACDCEVGEMRIAAFRIYENIRLAARAD